MYVRLSSTFQPDRRSVEMVSVGWGLLAKASPVGVSG